MDMFFTAADLHRRGSYAISEAKEGIYGDGDLTRAPKKIPVGMKGRGLGITTFDRMFCGSNRGGHALDLPSLHDGDEDEMIALLDAKRRIMNEDDLSELLGVSDDVPEEESVENDALCDDEESEPESEQIRMQGDDDQVLQEAAGENSSRAADNEQPSESVGAENGSEPEQAEEALASHGDKDTDEDATHDPGSCDRDECEECFAARMECDDYSSAFDDDSPARERISPACIKGEQNAYRTRRLEPGMRGRHTRSGLTGKMITQTVCDRSGHLVLDNSGNLMTREVPLFSSKGSFNCGQQPKYKEHRRGRHDHRMPPKRERKLHEDAA